MFIRVVHLAWVEWIINLSLYQSRSKGRDFCFYMKPRTWLALGDSYTIGESVPEEDRYAVQAVRELKEKGILFEMPEFIARTGWTTRDLLTAIKNRNLTRTYDLITLLIGVNNQYQGRPEEEFASEFAGLLNLAIEFAGKDPSHVIVLSIPDYSVTPFAKDLNRSKITQQLDGFNRIIKKTVDGLGTNYLDITTGNKNAAEDIELVAEDGLHFSGKEYARWAVRIVKKLEILFPGN